MHTPWRHSILVRTTVIVITVFSLLGALSLAITSHVTRLRANEVATVRLNQILETVENTASVACFVGDQTLAGDVAEGLLKNAEVLGVVIVAGDKILARRYRPEVGANPPVNEQHMTHTIYSPFNPEMAVGRILLTPNTSDIEGRIREEVRFVAMQIAGQLATVALAVIVALLVIIVRPIKSISDRLHRMNPTAGQRLTAPQGHANTEIGRLVGDVNELAGHLVSALEDERALRVQREFDEKRYRAIFENAETGIFILGADTELSSWNPAFGRLLELPAPDPEGASLRMGELAWEEPSRLASLIAACLETNTPASGDMVLLSNGGLRRWLNIVLTPVGDEMVQGVVHDVTEHKEAEDSAMRLAVTDTLTGVANRLGMEERLHALLRKYSISQSKGFALFLVDIDDFKRVNDTLGRRVGDEILITVATRLSDCIKNSDIIARLSAHVFAIALPEVSRGEDADNIAARIVQALRQHHFVEGSPLQLHSSLGITLCPSDGTDIATLLGNAELALGRAKAGGGNTYVFFDPALAEAAEQRRHTENDLRLAVQQQQFVLHYQPIVDLPGNRLAGAEVLIRWQHPERGLVPPDAFIPLAEETGLISDIGLWALNDACEQLARWQGEGIDRYLSLNVSGCQIPDGLPPAALAEAVQRHGIAPSGLALEITEGVLMEHVDKALAWLNAARDLGFRIYLDDFGTGYSSLSYLKRFPVDTLKVDKGFVEHMCEDSHDRSLVEAVMAMAHSLGLDVVAEGVETSAHVQLLRTMNCRYAQGYYFSRPIPIEEFDAVAGQVTDILNAAAAQ